MVNRLQIDRLRSFRSLRLLYWVAVLSITAILFQFLILPFGSFNSTPSSHVNITSILFMTVSDTELKSNNSQSARVDILHEFADSDSDEADWSEDEKQLPNDNGEIESVFTEWRRDFKENVNGVITLDANANWNKEESTSEVENRTEALDSSVPFEDLLHPGLVSQNSSSAMVGKTGLNKGSNVMTPISYMKTVLLQISPSANSKRPRQLSARDKELLKARHQIKNAPVIRNVPKDYASLFRNYSTFIRSYELMERMMRVYIYKEGQKPVFHDPHLKGVYASEGWFMKLMEKNRQYVARDPRKAHLFYLPFSSRRLRSMLYEQNFATPRDLDNHLKDYVQIIATKYRFWNRTKGADHFLVACHDWALSFTNESMGSCIRAVCNTNLAKGFQIRKDVALPVTMVPLKSGNPLEDIGGSHPSDRHILAFFSGSMHGDLRPILLKHWSNKTSDMKILGPLGHNVTNAARYRAFMKTSKYCICARGYDVHTPRVIESIYFECVPVIISDNYVPPLFDVFEWESFAVFVLEEDIPNLRNILLSIPESKYIEMQNRVKLVQRHFLWHKVPVKYDVFHMILHSIWYRRVFQVKI
ncbi:OLC1v1037414C1 [Oldenlandia corymbosa var. corymbosa]|uniref:OLC1v1037414C1 n=1 Tax=Oldenlandia corymbosa var. corymbosa TaxID=529605 RepID=A0AAV1CZ06_OLDCO|nr:OLC1v1037414C1 [Oldenlandia corymbosa var. corymbosa]